jgi:hypothetical protein
MIPRKPKSRKRKFKEISENLEEKKEDLEYKHYYNYFNKFKQLDSNVIGIIFSCIADDFNFLLYLRENNIKPYYNPIKWDKVNFYHVSRAIERLDDEFIREFTEQLDWEVITDIQIKNQEFLEKYDNLIAFDVISNKMKFDETLDYNFFLKYKDNLNWTKIARWDYIAEDFIDIFHIELDWDILSKQQGLTRYLLEKYIDKLVVDQLQTNINIKEDLKREIIARREELDLDRDLERELNNIDEDHEIDEEMPLLEEIDNVDQLLPEHFHPEMGQPNNYQQELEEEDSDLDLGDNNEYDSDEFFPEPVDNIPDEMTGINYNENYTISPPLILPNQEDIVMNPNILPTNIIITTDIIIDILDEDNNN